MLNKNLLKRAVHKRLKYCDEGKTIIDMDKKTFKQYGRARDFQRNRRKCFCGSDLITTDGHIICERYYEMLSKEMRMIKKMLRINAIKKELNVG